MFLPDSSERYVSSARILWTLVPVYLAKVFSPEVNEVAVTLTGSLRGCKSIAYQTDSATYKMGGRHLKIYCGNEPYSLGIIHIDLSSPAAKVTTSGQDIWGWEMIDVGMP